MGLICEIFNRERRFGELKWIFLHFWVIIDGEEEYVRFFARAKNALKDSSADAFSAFSLATRGAKKKLTKRNAVGVSPVATGEEGFAPSTARAFEESKQTRKRDLREFASQTSTQKLLTKICFGVITYFIIIII